MIGRWRNHKPLILTGLLALFLFASSPAYAACTNPAAGLGTIVYNADQNAPQVCTGSGWVALGALNPAAGGGSCSSPSAVEGAIVYNNDFDVLQYCDGTNWIAVQAAPAGGGGGGCTAPSSCPNIGDVCSDGSQFAGFVLYNNSSCEPLYVTDDNQSAGSQWKNATGTDDISTDDDVDGKVNAANRGGVISNFPAFDLCESNTYHGKSDWYLPARVELNLLWLNRAAINANAAAPPSSDFKVDYYWSSTELTTSNVFAQHFGVGSQPNSSKVNTGYDVRCVRRD